MRQQFFKFSTQKYLNKSFLLSNIAFYILSQKFAIRQIRALNLNITFSISLIFIFQAKITKIRYFGSKFSDFYFCINFCKKTNLTALISNMTICFENCCLKHPDEAFQILHLRNLHKTFFLEKFPSHNFKYDNSFLKVHPKNTQTIYFQF